MKGSTIAVMIAAVAQARARDCGYGGCTEYSTYQTLTPTVSFYTTKYQSACTTPIVYQPHAKTHTKTVTFTYTKPGDAATYTSYVPTITTETLPASTLTEKRTYTIEVTDTRSTTIYETCTVTDTYIITSNNTITVPKTVPTTIAVPTTEYDTQYVPTTYVSSTTITEKGKTYVTDFTVTDTVTQVKTTHVPVAVPTTVEVTEISTRTASGTISLVTVVDTETLPGPTVVSLQPATTITIQLTTTIINLSTVVQNGATSIMTVTQVSTLPQVTVISVQPGQTLPGQTIIQQPPGTTIEETVEYTALVPITVYVTMTAPPTTITVAPPPPASTCNGTGFFPENNDACRGDDCYIDFDLPAAVHWDLFPGSPPLLTSITFRNTASSQTCITTICNSAAFTSFYARSLASCARPPCPSNYLDCDCNIMVGPLVLPNGETTSVLQDGSSGWNLNLGMVQTGHNLPSCAGGNPQCVTSTTATRTRPLVYTDDVITLAPTGTYVNGSFAKATEYLLPQLPAYFGPNDPFGNCQTAIFPNTGNEGEHRMLRPKLARRMLEKRADAASYTWPGTPNIRRDITSDVPQSQVQGADSPAPVATTAPTATVTATTNPVATTTETPSPQNPRASTPAASSAGQPAASNPSIGASHPGTSPNTGTAPTIVSPGSSSSTFVQSQGPAESQAPNSRKPGAAVYTTIIPASSVVVTDSLGAPNGVVSTSLIPARTETLTGTPPPPPAQSSQTDAVGSSATTGTSLTTGADGRVTAYVTVFYSMVTGPSGSSSATTAGQTGVASSFDLSGALWACVVATLAFCAL